MSSYNKCICGKCGSQFATLVANDDELKEESCPHCGEKQLKISAPLSFAEINSLFYGGG